ncbi:hypothetical protein [Bradyrhizobium sp. 170]|uniref:hypothetical protein n=1 Tax=Bradyrhizobium sp. 170 TaxID=2782641 RepID=UPI001FFFB5BE|nr:hypothetical protein [Bradyrhizobium sp. 170]UPK02823.1 hypothetical protein IVB05_35520 [Bradyrhizobium sp. 170]
MRDIMELIRAWVPFLLVIPLTMGLLEWIGKPRVDSSGRRVIDESKAAHRGIIWVGEVAALLFVICLAVAGAVMGSLSSALTSSILNLLGLSLGNDSKFAATVGAILGAFGGFVTGALATSFLFAVFAIERNTRRAAAFLERLESEKLRAS